MAPQTLRNIGIACLPDRVVVTFNRPDRYNVLDIETLAELAVALDQLVADPRIRHDAPLLLSGAGDVFSLGPDVRELAGFSTDAASAYSRLGHQAVSLLENWPGVTIAHLQGYAMGAGLELALSCDILAADPQVRLGLPGLAWALLPCLGGLRRLRHRVGPLLAHDLLLRGTLMDGVEAHAAGLVDRLLTQSGHLEQLITDSAEFTATSVAAIRALRTDCYGPEDIRSEAELFAEPFASGECQRRLRGLL